jgi:hypothetical protein
MVHMVESKLLSIIKGLKKQEQVCSPCKADYDFYELEAYLMHLTDRLQFLNCSVWDGGMWSSTL